MKYSTEDSRSENDVIEIVGEISEEKKEKLARRRGVVRRMLFGYMAFEVLRLEWLRIYADTEDLKNKISMIESRIEINEDFEMDTRERVFALETIQEGVNSLSSVDSNGTGIPDGSKKGAVGPSESA